MGVNHQVPHYYCFFLGHGETQKGSWLRRPFQMKFSGAILCAVLGAGVWCFFFGGCQCWKWWENDGKNDGTWWKTYVGNDGKMMEHDGHEYGRIMENKPEKYEKMMGEIVEMSSSFSHKHLDFFQQLLRKTVQQRLRFYPMDYRIGKFAATWATCTWWLIPVSKWITTPVISELTLLRASYNQGYNLLTKWGWTTK